VFVSTNNFYCHLQAVAGLAADGRQIVSRTKSEAASYEK
jgi:20S proteasome alpha/beta subunit